MWVQPSLSWTHGVTTTNMAIIFTAPESETGFAGALDFGVVNAGGSDVDGALKLNPPATPLPLDLTGGGAED